MIESELNNLEIEVDSFIEAFQKLNTENSSLQKQVAHLNSERSALLDKEKKIATSLRKIITQLQDELSCQIQ
jgi:uncharacterized protein (TIGR02449 family)